MNKIAFTQQHSEVQMNNNFSRNYTKIIIVLIILLSMPFISNHSTAAKPDILSFITKASTLKVGKSKTFSVNTTQKVKWSSSNKKIATVNKNGKVTAKRSGKVYIYAKTGETKIKTKLKVTGKKLVGIDPGHQIYGNNGTEPIGPGSKTCKTKVTGGTRGTTTGLAEYQLNLTIAQKLKKELWNRGYDVVMTRTKHNVNITNIERAKKINKSGADICIRIHADGGPAGAKGATVLTPSANNSFINSKNIKKSLKLSKAILNNYCASTGINNRGISYRDDLTGTNWSIVPTTLVELGFMTNPSDDKFMASDSGQSKMVKGLADGIDEYFGY